MHASAKPPRDRSAESTIPHGTSSGYKYWGCRCNACVEQNRTGSEQWRRAHGVRPRRPAGEAFLRDLSDPRHGTENGYGNLGCRCQRCRDAHTEELHRRIARKSVQPVPSHLHGTHMGYRVYRCRCEVCAAFWARAKREYRARAARGFRA